MTSFEIGNNNNEKKMYYFLGIQLVDNGVPLTKFCVTINFPYVSHI